MLLIREPPGGIQRNLEFGVGGGRRAQLPGGHLHILLADGGHHIAGGEVARRKLLRIEPDAHRVVAAAEDLHIPHARQPRQHIPDVQHRVVAQVQRVVSPAGGSEVDDECEVG